MWFSVISLLFWAWKELEEDMEKLEDQNDQEEQVGFEPGRRGCDPSDIATRPRGRDDEGDELSG